MANFPLSFTVEVKNSDEIKKKVEEWEDSLKGLKGSAEDAAKPLDDVGESLKDVSKADASKTLDDTDEALKNVKSSAGDAQSEIEGFNDAIGDTDTKADASKSSLDGLDTSYSNVSTSASDAQTNIDNSVQALEGVDSAGQGASSGLDAVGTAFEGVSTSAVEADQNIRNASEGIEGIGTTTGQATTALDGLGSAFDGAGTSTTTFNDVLSSTGTQAQAASGGLTPLNTVLGQVGGATQQAQGGFQGFNSSLGIMTGFIGTATAGALQFVTALNNLHGAQIKVDATQAKLSTTSEAVAKAQKKLNDLLASGTATTEQIEQATLDLTQATDKNNIAIERAGKAQDDLNIKYAKFATDVLPSVIQTVTSTIGAASQLKGAFGDIGKGEIVTGLEAVGGAAAIAVAGFKGLEVAIKAIQGIQAQFNGQSEETVKKQKEVLEAGKSSSVGGYIDLIDKLFGVSKGLDESLPKAKELDKANKDSAASAQTTAQAFDVTTGSTKSLGSEMGLTGEQAKQVAGALGQNAEATKQLAESAGQAEPAVNSLQGSVRASGEAYAGAKAEVQGYSGLVKTTAEAIREAEQAMQDDTRAKELNAEATRALIGSTQETANVIATLDGALADTESALSRLNTELTNQEAVWIRYQTAVNEGHIKFQEWVKTSQDAATTQATFKADLEAMANTFGGLPGFMEGTVQEYQAFIEANTQGGEAVDRFADMALQSWQSLVSGAEPLFNDLKEAWTKVINGMWEEGDVEGELIDPVLEAFRKLPPAVAQTLSEVELKALSFQGEFAATAEQAGTAWATNLQANMGQGFDQAIQEANQAAADVLKPFIEQHPETAQMFQPLFDAMNQTGPGAAQAVQEVLTELAGMPGPMGETAAAMLQQYQEKFAGQLPGVTKTGVEGAITDLTQIMAEGFNALITKLNELINTGIKQDPASVPEITANTNPANEAIQLIGTSLDQMKTYLTENPLSITVSTEAANASITELNAKIDAMAGKNVTITVDTGPAGIAIQGLQAQLDAMAGKNVAITVDTGAAGIAIQGLQQQIDAVVGKNVTITVDTGPAGIAITGLQGQIDGVHGANVAITVDTGAAGIAIREIQGQIDNVHGTNVYITVDTSGAQAAIQQLQQQINSLQQSMGGMGGGYTPGYQSPYGSYQGAYGSPYGYAQGFGPAVVNRPTRMLVGEAGPEFVSVIPMKGRNRKNPPRSVTAAAGMGQQSIFGQNYGYSGQGLWQTDAEEEAYKRQVQQSMQQGSQQGSSQGTQQGFDQGMPGMQNAVQEGASQGVQEGMQQGYQEVSSRIQQALQQGNMAEAMAGFGTGYGFNWSGGAMGTNLGMGGGAQYPTAPSNTEIWGAGRFTWGGGAAGAQLGGGNMGGAQYPTAGVPMGAQHAIGFGSRPIKYTWGGGRSGTTLTPHGPHVGQGLPGPDPHAFGGGGAGGGNPYAPGGAYSQPGGGTPEGWTGAGTAASKSFVKAFDAGVEGQGQLINGVPATILSGNSREARDAGNQAGTAAGEGFAEGFNSQMPSGGLTQGQAGYPKAYTGEVPASYGKPLGQLINGIAATILPGQGPRGPPMQAAFGMHQKLRRDTLIQAHRNERVDISPGGNAAEAAGKARDYANATMDRITALLEKLLSQGSTFKVDFNVDGRKMSSVAAKHMGTTGYGDK